jgi:hypothetical protein
MEESIKVLFTLTYAEEFFSSDSTAHRNSVCDFLDKLEIDIKHTTVNQLYAMVAELRPNLKLFGIQNMQRDILKSDRTLHELFSADFSQEFDRCESLYDESFCVELDVVPVYQADHEHESFFKH